MIILQEVSLDMILAFTSKQPICECLVKHKLVLFALRELPVYVFLVFSFSVISIIKKTFNILSITW